MLGAKSGRCGIGRGDNRGGGARGNGGRGGGAAYRPRHPHFARLLSFPTPPRSPSRPLRSPLAPRSLLSHPSVPCFLVANCCASPIRHTAISSYPLPTAVLHSSHRRRPNTCGPQPLSCRPHAAAPAVRHPTPLFLVRPTLATCSAFEAPQPTTRNPSHPLRSVMHLFVHGSW